MINFTQTTEPVVRETKAPFVYASNGEIKTEEIRVRFRSLSIKALKEQKALIAEKGDDAYISDTLFAQVAELPDLTDDKGKPIDLTLDVFESMDLDNLKAIKKAIDDEINPK